MEFKAKTNIQIEGEEGTYSFGTMYDEKEKFLRTINEEDSVDNFSFYLECINDFEYSDLLSLSFKNAIKLHEYLGEMIEFVRENSNYFEKQSVKIEI